MELSDVGIDLIVTFEGLRLNPYNDGRKFATVGIGHLLHESPVTSEDQSITKEQAYALFRQDAAQAVYAVNTYVKVPLTQNQFDALVSWVYNLGTGTLRHSTMLVVLNQGNYATASSHMKLYNTAGGVIEDGLVRRRAAEVALFLTQ